MYGFTPQFDFSFCIGSHLDQIGIGKFDVQFSFESGAKIAMQGDIDLFRGGEQIAQWSEDAGWSSLHFRDLLNQSVQRGRVVNKRLIELQFTDGLVLHLHDSSDQYESMQIYPSDSESSVIVI